MNIEVINMQKQNKDKLIKMEIYVEYERIDDSNMFKHAYFKEETEGVIVKYDTPTCNLNTDLIFRAFLDEPLLRRLISKINHYNPGYQNRCWRAICCHQRLSKEFISDFTSKIDFEILNRNNNLDPETKLFIKMFT